MGSRTDDPTQHDLPTGSELEALLAQNKPRPGTKLVDEETGQPINAGDIRVDHHGDRHLILGWREGSHAGSTGRVYVFAPGFSFYVREFFPGVVGAKVLTESDAAYWTDYRNGEGE